jgi:zinc protease
MRHLGRLSLLACATMLTPMAASAASSAEPAPLSTLVKQVALPYTKFQLPNGLTVIVHEDHKAPVVAVSVWYNVGSKDEPKGETGFAHLYEHLMFYGSDNVRQPIMPFLEKIGATDWNGSTWFDRTNYFERVPKSVL